MMELQILEYQQPGKITFNYDELRAALIAEMEKRKGIVYTEDKIKDVKTDRAGLNRLDKALNDERLKREKEFMAPFAEFKSQINDLRQIITSASEDIDRQIKEFEQMQKAKKSQEIADYFKAEQESGAIPKWLELDKIAEARWMNATCKMDVIKKEITARMDVVKRETDVIAGLPEYSFEAMEIYKTTLDLSRAMTEGQRLADIQKRKAAEEERRAAEEEARKILAEKVKGQKQATAEEAQRFAEKMDADKAAVEKEPNVRRWWVNIRACVTLAEANDLKAYFAEHNIEYTAITER